MSRSSPLSKRRKIIIGQYDKDAYKEAIFREHGLDSLQCKRIWATPYVDKLCDRSAELSAHRDASALDQPLHIKKVLHYCICNWPMLSAVSAKSTLLPL